MSQLVRHIAGIPTATEQRCVRCCEVIIKAPGYCMFPGNLWLPFTLGQIKEIIDCTPVDLCARVPIEPPIPLYDGSCT
jgi:hypothetical protein